MKSETRGADKYASRAILRRARNIIGSSHTDERFNLSCSHPSIEENYCDICGENIENKEK